MSDLRTLARGYRALAAALGEEATVERDDGHEAVGRLLAANARAYAGAAQRLERLAQRDLEITGAVPPDEQG